MIEIKWVDDSQGASLDELKSHAGDRRCGGEQDQKFDFVDMELVAVKHHRFFLDKADEDCSESFFVQSHVFFFFF